MCDHRRWQLLALNVRTNHVHVVVCGAMQPEVAMGAFKAWSTRRLRETGIGQPDRCTWARHGSTRYLWTEAAVQRAVSYVVEWQDHRPLPGRAKL